MKTAYVSELNFVDLLLLERVRESDVAGVKSLLKNETPPNINVVTTVGKI